MLIVCSELGRARKKCGAPSIPKMLAHLTTDLADELSLAELAQAAGSEKMALCRWFRQRYQIGPIRWLWTIRTLVAARILRHSLDCTLTDIAFACGFKSSAHFTRLFREIIGMSPSEYKKVPWPLSSRKGPIDAFNLLSEVRENIAPAVAKYLEAVNPRSPNIPDCKDLI
jgi:AraC-like DNA-binding protein